MEMKSVWVYDLRARLLCLGERTKKGTYRSTLVSSIPYSQITGALRARFRGEGQEASLHAVGKLTKFTRASLMRGVRDAAVGVSKLPIEADILDGAEGLVYIVHNEDSAALPERFDIWMGAFRSQGLGKCQLERKRDQQPLPLEPTKEGVLGVRLPDDATVLDLFGVTRVIAPVWGYLFRPDAKHEGGQYVRALFEGSRVQGPEVLLKKEGT